jgi:hypothetical protein
MKMGTFNESNTDKHKHLNIFAYKGEQSMNDIGKYKQSFFWTIVFFVFIDIGTLLGWVSPKFLWPAGVMMLLAACSAYISGSEIGVSKGLAALIAIALFLSFIAVLFLKGYLRI